MTAKNQVGIKSITIGLLAALTVSSIAVRDTSSSTGTVLFGGKQLDAKIINQYDYCQAPYPDPDTYTPLSNSKLVFVQTVTRHGTRTPSFFVPNNKAVYNDCGDSLNHLYEDNVHGDEVSGTVTQSTYSSKSGPKGFGYAYWQGNCFSGQLVNFGKKQQYDLGSVMRKIYVDKLGYLSKTLAKNSTGSIYVRTSNIPRTTDSAINFLGGLYPPQFREQGAVVKTGYVPSEQEYMYFNPAACPNISKLFATIMGSEQYQQYFNKTVPDLNRFINILGVPASNTAFSTQWGNAFDAAMAPLCMNKPLPCNKNGTCLTAADAKLGLENFYQEHLSLRRDNSQFANLYKLGEAPMLDDLISNIKEAIEFDEKNTNPALSRPFSLYSAHDETIVYILAALNASNEDMLPPPYTSSIVTEVWKDLSTCEYKVRIIYNGRILKVGGARGATSSLPVTIQQTVATATNPAWCDFNGCSLDKYMAYLSQYITNNTQALCTQ
ncbi:hypothetical protein BB558_004316 [Smittium angustum]|uniref:Acid phosphatase n=1 Tax=Smittium angustum TaxID=133377 RepID=A0A2U1J3K6_SMIAN|nr:hypothetical protein BB558_004316 [Smittium angustum]